MVFLSEATLEPEANRGHVSPFSGTMMQHASQYYHENVASSDSRHWEWFRRFTRVSRVNSVMIVGFQKCMTIQVERMYTKSIIKYPLGVPFQRKPDANTRAAAG